MTDANADPGNRRWGGMRLVPAQADERLGIKFESLASDAILIGEMLANPEQRLAVNKETKERCTAII